MKFLVSLLGLGISGGGIFIGTLQQNLLQIEKPEIDILFEEIVKDIRKFAEENPMTEKNLWEIKSVDSDEDTKKNNLERKDGVNKQSQYTFQSLTNIWMGLLSGYISLWYDKSNTWGDPNNPYLRVKDEFTEENKVRNFKEAKKSMEKEKNKFKEIIKKETEIENIYKKIKDFIFLVKLPEKYNHSDSYNNPYENYIKTLKWN